MALPRIRENKGSDFMTSPQGNVIIPYLWLCPLLIPGLSYLHRLSSTMASYDLGHPIGSSSVVPSPNAAPVHQANAASAPSTATLTGNTRTTPTTVDDGSNGCSIHHSTSAGTTAAASAASGPPAYASEESQAEHYVDVNAQPATVMMDPDIPSSESAPTALPTNPAASPEEQRQAVKDEHPATVAREVEKTKGEERELKGEAPEGTVITGLEDDRLYTMLRRFDTVCQFSHPALIPLTGTSKSPMSSTPLRSSHPPSQTSAHRHYQTSLPTPRSSNPTSSGRSPPSVLLLSAVHERLGDSCLGPPKNDGGRGRSALRTLLAGSLGMRSRGWLASSLRSCVSQSTEGTSSRQ